MKVKLQWLALVALCASLSSCGLPAAAARTVGNTMNTAMSAAGRVTDSLLYPGG